MNIKQIIRKNLSKNIFLGENKPQRNFSFSKDLNRPNP
jgi:hypothetical protein